MCTCEWKHSMLKFVPAFPLLSPTCQANLVGEALHANPKSRWTGGRQSDDRCKDQLTCHAQIQSTICPDHTTAAYVN
ncbi:hypothetical protein BD769DRAFT_1456979 [Suillus cothurnatus]|nr:hypothetical protein BD769DRAFT_1456979 [Suillus cothurnatus]